MDPADWPLFALRLRTARIEMRLPTDDDLGELVAVMREGVLEDAGPYPFAGPWILADEPQRSWSALQFNWRSRADFTPERFHLSFITVVEGRIAGVQGLMADQFPRLRQISSGSWLGREWQGKGYGREMRAAMLTFAFEALGAEVALSEARIGNSRSIAVSRALGYRDNGTVRMGFGADETDESLNFRLDRADWETRHDWPAVTIEGWDTCAPMFQPG